ncbi:MAG: hypothetical protein ABIN67_04980 [Ferruginibacter sp.]
MKFNRILAGLMLCFTVIHFSCQRNSSSSKEADLYYFPEKNTYYDVNTASYYYSLDSAKTWDSMVYTGTDIGATLGVKIPLKKVGRYAWSKNDSVRKANNGRVLNLVNTRTLLVARTDSLSRVKPVVVFKPKPVEKVEEEPEEAPKKGLKKLFNKLFGKKKEKKE